MFSKVLLILAVATASLANVLPLKEPIGHAQPYKFGYSVKDHHGEQHREEAGNGVGVVTGNYGFTDDRGIARQVNYVADHAGFRAQVKTNEPGTAQQSPAAVQMISTAPYSQIAGLPYNYKPNIPIATGLAQTVPVLGFAPGYAGYSGLGYNGLEAGYAGMIGLGGYGLGYGGYGDPYAGNAYGYGSLGYSGLLGGLGYGGFVN